MQYRVSDLIGKTIRATDGVLGKVYEFYFDDATWTIRYLVAETGSWLFGRTVLISVVALGKPDSVFDTFPVNLTCDQVRNSPDIDTQRPVSRQHEVELAEYYLWPHYWKCVHGVASPITQHPHKPVPFTNISNTPMRHDDLHLRSSRDITGYTIYGANGDIGTVKDFLVDDENWMIRHLVAGAKKRMPVDRVFIPTLWIKCVNWADKTVHLDYGSESLETEWNPTRVSTFNHVPG